MPFALPNVKGPSLNPHPGPLPRGEVRTGVLLVGHGTRSELGRRQCQGLAEQISAGLEPQLYIIELAYLELAVPTIEESIARLVKKQVQRLVVAPLLLFAAGHAKEDIPAAVRSALDAVGARNLPVLQTPPLALQEQVIKLADERFREAADPRIGPPETFLLLIGRGSRDEAATAEMRQLGELLNERLGVGRTQVGFLAMAQPPAQEIITAAISSRFRQIVVQPHLLFHGDLLDRLCNNVSVATAKSPAQVWRMSRVLGEGLEGSAAPDSAKSSSLARIIQQAIVRTGNH